MERWQIHLRQLADKRRAELKQRREGWCALALSDRTKWFRDQYGNPTRLVGDIPRDQQHEAAE